MASACSSAFTDSRSEILRRCAASSAVSMRRRSKRWQARQDRDRHLANLGRREDEFYMLRRLLERLQQAVEGLRGKHVDFIDDVDLVARRDGAVAHLLDDLADIVDTGVGSGVHLDDIDMTAFHDRGAMLAHFRQIDARLVDAIGLVIERAGEECVPSLSCRHP
jgi:hypothetical protein